MEQTNKNNLIAKWLFMCCFFVALMVLIGGLTRLTGSGLSMTDWHPVHGVVPPLNEQQWQEEFSSYRASPEYKKINYGMELSEFKKIFLWEYVHRVAGRVTGLVFLLPLLYFIFAKAISFKVSLKLFSVFLIGGVQGLIGWWMVKSGLYDSPSVSHYRLAIHLSFAFLIFSILFWQALNFYLNKAEPFKKCRFSVDLLILIFALQVVYGAFVAGLDAGLTYNTWPLMDGDVVPQGFMAQGFLSILSDITSIQFIHRWLAFLFLAMVIYVYCSHRVSIRNVEVIGLTAIRLKKSLNMLMALVVLQIIIGIKTLLLVVPVPLASLHQMVALIILGNLVYIRRVING